MGSLWDTNLQKKGMCRTSVVSVHPLQNYVGLNQLLRQILHPNTLADIEKKILTGFMAVRKRYSGIKGWLLSKQYNGFMDGQ